MGGLFCIIREWNPKECNWLNWRGIGVKYVIWVSATWQTSPENVTSRRPPILRSGFLEIISIYQRQGRPRPPGAVSSCFFDNRWLEWRPAALLIVVSKESLNFMARTLTARILAIFRLSFAWPSLTNPQSWQLMPFFDCILIFHVEAACKDTLLVPRPRS